jgi:hypothetical protein
LHAVPGAPFPALRLPFEVQPGLIRCGWPPFQPTIAADKGKGFDVIKMSRLLILVYVAYLLLLTFLSPAGFPTELKTSSFFPYLSDKPVGEDGYYMLTIAWNIAQGHGIVYNYSLPTTGIQPLSTFIYAGLAWIAQTLGGDRWTFVRMVLLFGGISLLFFARIMGSTARKMTEYQNSSGEFAYSFGFLATLFCFTLFRWFTYGLETGIYLICIALFIRFTLDLPKSGKMQPHQVILVGVLGGITVLCRIDFGVVLMIFLLLAVFRSQITLWTAFVSGIITTLIVSPWFLYSHRVTESWLPSSGAAQSSLIMHRDALFRLHAMAHAVLSYMTPWIYSNPGKIFEICAFVSLAAVVVFLFRKYDAKETTRFLFKKWPFFLNWTIAITVLIIVYLLFFWAAHFYQRYAAPIFIPVVIVMTVLVAGRAEKMPEIFQRAVLILMPVCFFVWAVLSLHTGHTGNGHAMNAGFIQSNFQSSRVGVFQSGVIGFFNPNVINLDGKVNHSALIYARRSELHRYVDMERIDRIIDWPDYINGALDRNWQIANWEKCEVQVPYRESICLKRKKQ